jgi:hypothetical protein|tara:strand:+ start:2442 stop:2705 length:264 start_codon:yes stop_codon:yes gene_type:complete
MASDLFVLLVITLTQFNIISGATILLLISAGYLTTKALMFFNDIMSKIDLGIAFYIILMIFGLKTFIYYIIAFWFLYKLLFTIVGDM